jgi:hypothetical protein
MKKVFNKISIVILLIFGVFAVTGCEKEQENGNNNGKTEIVLPTESKHVKSDETVYVIYNQNNEIDTIKSSHHFSNAGFFKYEVFGKFLETGHLNITNGQAKIEISDNKALVPSLENHDDFFYTLNLDPTQYKNKLPFTLQTTFKLNDNDVTFGALKNATGKVTLNYKFTANTEAHVYYQKNYAAQVQIPIDITTAKIIEANDAMASVLVGTTNTLAYMVMPGETKEIIIKLEVKNFKFNGLQAVYQPLDQMSSIGGMLDFETLGIDQLAALPLGVQQVINGVNLLDTNVNELFIGMGANLTQIKTQFADPSLGQFINVLMGLNFDVFKNDGSYTPEMIAKKEELLAIVTPLEALLAELQVKFNELGVLYNEFNNNYDSYLAVTNQFELKYQYFLSSVAKLQQLKDSVTALSQIDFTNINLIAENRDEIINNLASMDVLLEEIKTIYTNTISAMYFYPDAFEPIAHAMFNVVSKAGEVFGLFVPIKSSLESLSAKIGEGIAGNWFNPMVLEPIGTLKGMLDHQDPTFQQPGIIQTLGLMIMASAATAEQIPKIQELVNMYQVDPLTGMRQIDAIYLGFVQINHSLLLKAEGQNASFYDGISKLAGMKDFVALIPTPLNIELPSFLSDDNQSPFSLQFIITQK